MTYFRATALCCFHQPQLINMKTLIALFIGIFVGTHPLFAQTKTAPNPTIIGELGFADQYVGFGNGVILDSNPRMQSMLLIIYPNGFNFLLWNTVNSKKWNSTLGSEVDYGVGWSGKLGKEFKLDTSLVYFDEPKVFKLGAGDIIHSKVVVSRDIRGFETSLGWQKYKTLPKSGFTVGDLLSFGSSKKLQVDDAVSLGNSLAIVYDTGGTGLDKGLFLRGVTAVEWKISKRVKVTLPQFHWFIPLTTHDRRRNDLMIYGSIRRMF